MVFFQPIVLELQSIVLDDNDARYNQHHYLYSKFTFSKKVSMI